MNKILKNFVFFLSIIGLFLLKNQASAATVTPPPIKDDSYAGKYVSQSLVDPVKMSAGGSKEITVKIKNTGQTTWNNTGSNFVTIYTVDPNYHASVFYGKGWIGKDQPAKLTKTTKPGETGQFTFKLYAPTKGGEYTENFYLAAENKSWVQGTFFFIKVNVNKTQATDDKSVVTSDETKEKGNSSETADDATEVIKEYKAGLVFYSQPSVTAKGGEQINFLVRYVNEGNKTWNSYLWQESGSRPKSGTWEKVKLTDASWLSTNKINAMETVVEPGKVLEINYTFRAPVKTGQYIARFQLTADGHTLDNGTLELPVTVTEDASSDYQEPTFAEEESARALIDQPNIRVGLYKTLDPVKFVSDYEYNVYAGNELQGTLSANEQATLSYKKGDYSFKSADLNFQTKSYVRLIPNDLSNVFNLTNYTRQASGLGNKNFNAYRGIMEYKYSSKSSSPYVIEELPLDMYVAGIAETSNGAAMEYIKALLVAARSYAYANIDKTSSPDKKTFDVYATTVDQLYLGYNSELLMPRVVQAEEATYGEMVTYDGNPVVTPYFGHSAGKTKSWREAWGGADKPWLQSVECVHDKGLKMWGHGVGMSTHDASERADKDGWTYDQILKYYYTGVEVEKIY